MQLKDKIRGIILTGAYGDAFGAPVELWSPEFIEKKIGSKFIDKLIKTHKNDFIGQYTDDTEMVLATIKSINSKCGINYFDILTKFKEDYNFKRGYGFCTSELLEGKIEKKNKLSESNGGLMRISPIAIWNIMSSDLELKKCITEVLKLTNHNSVNSIECCFLYCKIIIDCIKENNINVTNFKNIIKKNINGLSIGNNIFIILDKERELDKIDDLEIYSTDCVETLMKVINAILFNFDNPKKALSHVVSYGGDTDTAASLVGALMGSIYGVGFLGNEITTVENYAMIEELCDNFTKLVKANVNI